MGGLVPSLAYSPTHDATTKWGSQLVTGLGPRESPMGIFLTFPSLTGISPSFCLFLFEAIASTIPHKEFLCGRQVLLIIWEKSRNPTWHYLLIYLSLSLSRSLGVAIYWSSYLSIHPSINLSIHPSMFPSVCLSICRSIDPSICLLIHLPIGSLSSYRPAVYLSVCLSVCSSVCRSIDLLIYLSYLSIYLTIYLSNYLSIYLSVYLSIYLSKRYLGLIFLMYVWGLL